MAGPSFCDYYNQARCRSCGWIEMDYETQLAAKERAVRERLAFLPGLTLEPAVASAQRGFRDRAKMAVTGSLENPVIGLVGEDRLDEGRELLACPIHHPRLNELMAAMPDLIRTHGWTPYAIQSRRGELKGLIAFYSPGSRQMYLRFVLRSRESLARIKDAVPELQARFEDLVCVSANIQPIPHAWLEGPEEVILSEKAFIEHLLGDVRLRLAPQAFVQTNTAVATRLYQCAAEWIAAVKPARMVDLFCGQGAFSFFAAASAERILGIEINAEAVKMARQTLGERAASGHLRFECADATRVDAEIAAFGCDLILVNPPRRGLGSAGLELIRRHKPAHLLYSSCSVESLARDLQSLADLYPVAGRVRVFDLFPHTEHFETLVCLKLTV